MWQIYVWFGLEQCDVIWNKFQLVMYIWVAVWIAELTPEIWSYYYAL
jgi:hypothetical protein